MSRSRWSVAALYGAMALGCGSNQDIADGQASADAVADAPVSSDAASPEDAADTGGRSDVAVAPPDSGIDAGDRGDARVGDDVPRSDAALVDAPNDRPAVDAPPADAGAAADAATTDAGPDASRDVPAAADAPAADASCAGSAPAVAVSSPTNGQVIETCSESEMPVHFDFVATVSASARVVSVGARWITPDGAEAPPPATLTAAPYSFRRQVGGPSSSGAPALGVFGVRGGWRVEFSALDACGRRTTVSQPFSLTFTSRRCPNP